MPLRFAEPATGTYHFPLTIRHLLAGALLSSADQRIIYRDQASYSYREFGERIGRLASVLKSVGADQGSTVAVMDWDSHRYLEAYFAVPMMGAVLQTVNVRLPESQVAYTLDNAKAEVLLVHRDFFPLAEAMLPGLPGIKAVIAIMDGSTNELPSFALGEYEALSSGASPDYPFEDFDENAIATTFYTTGTTGNPKGVCFSHRQLVLHTMACMAPFGAADGTGLSFTDVYMPLTPMFHVHAWGVPYVATMLGVKQVYPGRYDPDLICRMRTEHQVSYSHSVPTILRMVLDAADRAGTELSGWTFGVGGAPMTSQLCDEARRRGLRLLTGYGMSEAGPLIALARVAPEDRVDVAAEVEALTRSVSAPLVSVRIVDDHMNEVPHDGETRGEMVVRAPWLTPCYVGDRDASEALWAGGWMHTQDIATIDAKGYIKLRDRLKDVIKTGGEWIDSIQLEDLVTSADGVAEVAVIAVPDARWGERPLAVVVPDPGAHPDLETLLAPVERAIANNEITRYARFDQVSIVDALPRTSVGKIDKKLLRAQYSEGVPAGRSS